MSLAKPYHRIFRTVKHGANSGYSEVSYVQDKDYADSPANYINAFLLIQSDLEKIFEYIEPSQESLKTYSFRIHELLMRSCIEIEANFRAILRENTFDLIGNNHRNNLNMSVYKKIEITHHLSSYDIMLPKWNGPKKIIRPFEEWKNFGNLEWYNAYNISKHDRQDGFKMANLENLILAVSGLLVVLSSQFRTEEFSAGSTALTLSGYDYHDMSEAIGSLFRINFPNDWKDDEIYDFDWSDLQNESVRFEKLNYNNVAIPDSKH